MMLNSHSYSVNATTGGTMINMVGDEDDTTSFARLLILANEARTR